MPKARIYELAKKFGVDSGTILSTLKDMGEFVKSASSTVEAPVVRQLEMKFQKNASPQPQQKHFPKSRRPFPKSPSPRARRHQRNPKNTGRESPSPSPRRPRDPILPPPLRSSAPRLSLQPLRLRISPSARGPGPAIIPSLRPRGCIFPLPTTSPGPTPSPNLR